MPELGDIKRGRALGFKENKLHIYRACLGCGKPDWIVFKNGKPNTLYCHTCGVAREESRTKLSAALQHWNAIPHSDVNELTPPVIGEVRLGKDIGYSTNKPYIGHSCQGCGKVRWVELRHPVPFCRSCTVAQKNRSIGETRRVQAGDLLDKPLIAGEIRLVYNFVTKRTKRFLCHACIDCGKIRLVSPRKPSQRCSACAGKWKAGPKSCNWKGGRQVNRYGYVLVKLPKDDPFYPMCAKSGYVLENRLALAKHLGRLLTPFEEAHHKGDNKQDNRPEGLELRVIKHGTGYTEPSDNDKFLVQNHLLKREKIEVSSQLDKCLEQIKECQSKIKGA